MDVHLLYLAVFGLVLVAFGGRRLMKFGRQLKEDINNRKPGGPGGPTASV